MGFDITLSSSLLLSRLDLSDTTVYEPWIRALLRTAAGSKRGAGPERQVGGAYMKRELNLNFSGNEVYYTAFSLPVILKNSCSKLHCQKGFDLVPFSYQGVRGSARTPERDGACACRAILLKAVSNGVASHLKKNSASRTLKPFARALKCKKMVKTCPPPDMGFDVR